MGRYVIRRVLWMLLVLFVISLITFVMEHSVPGGPFDQEKKLPAEIIANLEKKYHLDEPYWKQYMRFLYDVLVPQITQGESVSMLDEAMINIKLGGDYYLRWVNFGPSFTSRSRTVNDIIREQLPVSIQLGIISMAIAITIGLPMGIVAALKQNTIWDYLGMSVAIFGVSVPVVAMGPVLVWIFGVTLKWLPPTGWGAKPPYLLFFIPRNLFSWDFWKYAMMPAFAVGTGYSAIIARLSRASLLQVVHEDYIRTARAKGLAERVVTVRHALRNALIPVVTILGPMFAAVLTGLFVVEQVFGIPGLGKYFITSIGNRDYPVIMGTILLYAIFLVIANVVVDVTYAWLDPRIRYE
ncbi:MAG TPA: ABC transporter permease [Chloroflexi bacterium]|mgnify:CR=1 FL=1|nr:ABC transporter permease [Chloroflexota bacterium]